MKEKNKSENKENSLVKLTVTGVLLILGFAAKSQIPQDIPHQSEPVDFTSLPNILFYIVLPILLGIFYYFWRKKQKRK